MSKVCERLFKPLNQASIQAALTNEMQIADVIDFCIKQLPPPTGGFNIWMTSYSISDEFIRRLYFIKKNHPINNFSLLLDSRAMKKAISIWHFLGQVITDCYFANNHSKLCLLQADGIYTTIMSSQNLTRGDLYETYCILNDSMVFDTFLDQLQYVIKHKTLSLHDAIEGKLGDN